MSHVINLTKNPSSFEFKPKVTGEYEIKLHFLNEEINQHLKECYYKEISGAICGHEFVTQKISLSINSEKYKTQRIKENGIHLHTFLAVKENTYKISIQSNNSSSEFLNAKPQCLLQPTFSEQYDFEFLVYLFFVPIISGIFISIYLLTRLKK